MVEKQEKGEDAMERLLARQEETAALVRGLVKQVDLYPYSYLYFSFRLYLTFVFVYMHLDSGHRWKSCAIKGGESRDSWTIKQQSETFPAKNALWRLYLQL